MIRKAMVRLDKEYDIDFTLKTISEVLSEWVINNIYIWVIIFFHVS